jgi:hypothetical protein
MDGAQCTAAGTFATNVDFGEASRLGFASLSHLHLGSNLKPGTLGIKFVHPYNPGVGVIDQSQSDVMVSHDTIGTIYCRLPTSFKPDSIRFK